MTKFPNKLKKPCFWPILDPFSQFWGKKKFFLKKSNSVTQKFIWISSTMPNFRKNDTIPRKYLDRRMDGRMKDGQTLFYRTLPATAGGPKTDWHEDIQMDTKSKKKFQKPILSLVNACPPDRVSVLSTKCGGCHPKGLIVASSHKIKQIIIIFKLIYAKANSLFC